MEKTLHFIASYNSQIIQAGFGIVFLLIIIYVYRLFFMSSQTDSGSGASPSIAAIDEKLNIIIDQQKNKVVVAVSAQASLAGGEGHEIEIDHLKAEIYNLHQKLKLAGSNPELSVGSAASGIPEAAGSSVEIARNDSSETSAEKVKLEEKVKDLQSRLSEYEIIADDIAELSQLRADNAKLVEQISLLKTEAKADPNPVQEAAGDKNLITEEVSSVSVDPPLADKDQNLMNDFAKVVLKKENQ